MNVLLGVTGCIAAYKAPLILRLLQREGINVSAIMTRSATEFIGQVTLEKLSGNHVISDMFQSPTTEIEHIALARRSDLLLVAPATANIVAKFASGIADDFLSTIYLSTTTPVVVAPAMNVEMWRHPATRENLRKLEERGVVVIPPGTGYQACGEVGEGRLAEPEEIADVVLKLLKQERALSGKRILVTAGPTVEDIDPVRFLSNRSSGKMGYAIALEAARRGAEVCLVSGPVSLPAPAEVELVQVRSTEQMEEAVVGRFAKVDVVVKAAAVADFRPANRGQQKRKKGSDGWALELVPTPDILSRLAALKTHQLLIGFAAESEALVENARFKLEQKQLDLIVANDISLSDSGFENDYNRVVFVGPSGILGETGRVPKSEVARLLLDRIEGLISERLKQNA